MLQVANRAPQSSLFAVPWPRCSLADPQVFFRIFVRLTHGIRGTCSPSVSVLAACKALQQPDICGAQLRPVPPLRAPALASPAGRRHVLSSGQRSCCIPLPWLPC